MSTQIAVPAVRSGSFKRPAMAVPPPSARRELGGPVDLMGAPMSFSRNAEIYGESEPADYLYKVLTDGRRQVGGFYVAGDIFGLESGEEHTFSAEAITECKVLVIKRSALMALAARDHEVSHQLWTITGGELRRVQDHIMLRDTSASNARSRLMWRLMPDTRSEPIL
jgi:CRP/FNR family nitrogen fixation transcriptional regulator